MPHVDHTGDGECDDTFNCDHLMFDMGDCLKMNDCDDVPWSTRILEQALGDEECDEGGTGSQIPNLNCRRFEYDEGDCKQPVTY